MMFVEKRKLGKSIKFYLVHSYREEKTIKKIRKYLGQDLKTETLGILKARAEEHIRMLLAKLNTEVFMFTLTKKQVEVLNKYSYNIRIHHLNEREWQKFTEDFVYNTNAIEGSAVQLDEVKDIIKEKKPRNREELETKGVAEAFGYIRKTKGDFSLYLIKKLHELCFKATKHFAGQFRNVDVVIKNSQGEIVHVGAEKEMLAEALDDLIGWYHKNRIQFKPLVLAAIIHNQFEHIHPFQDGNGRIGRLLLNYVLLKNNYPPINISLEDRQEYYQTLQDYSKKGDLKPTMRFLIKQYKKTWKKVATNIVT